MDSSMRRALTLICLCAGLAVAIGQGISLRNPAYVATLKPSAGTVSPPSIVAVFGTNSAVQNGQFTNSLSASATLAIIATSEFNAAANPITKIALTNTSGGSGGEATLLTRTNMGSSSEKLSIWYLANPPTGSSIEVTWASTANNFATFIVVGVSGNNASPFDSNITLDWNSGARPGITNSVTSSVNQLAIGIFASSEFSAGTVTDTQTGQLLAGKYFASGGDYDIQCSTNAGAATSTIGYTSPTVVQGMALFSVKP